jgi:small nuclear ribonucleoprotein G
VTGRRDGLVCKVTHSDQIRQSTALPTTTMSKASQPELKKVCPILAHPADAHRLQFMDKKLFVHLQGGRKVSGVLRGYDLFLNLVIDDAMEESTPAQKHPIGTVVCLSLSLPHRLLTLHR